MEGRHNYMYNYIALHKLQECIREVRSWMTVNKLKLNEEKTEFFIAASTHNMNYLNNVSLDVCWYTD